MHVVTEIRSDEIVAGHGVVLEVGGELGVRPDVGDAVRGSRTQRIGHIVKVHKRIVLNGVLSGAGQRAGAAADILIIGFPGNIGVLQQGHQMRGRALVIGRGGIIVRNPEIGSRLQPEIIRLARVNPVRGPRRRSASAVVVAMKPDQPHDLHGPTGRSAPAVRP